MARERAPDFASNALDGHLTTYQARGGQVLVTAFSSRSGRRPRDRYGAPDSSRPNQTDLIDQMVVARPVASRHAQRRLGPMVLLPTPTSVQIGRGRITGLPVSHR